MFQDTGYLEKQTRHDAIFCFLQDYTVPDLAGLYHTGMEVQVNVAQDEGARKELVKGSRAIIWTDPDGNTWYNYRIPKRAWQDPEDNSNAIQSFSLREHAEGIGLTGWNFNRRVSEYVAFDFDAIVGHSTQHTKGLSAEQLTSIKQNACSIPWVTVRTSTGGLGLHLYVFLEPNVPTSNHAEHAALAKAILSHMSALAGYNFASSVDTCGGNIWIWHRKYEKTGKNGFLMIKQGTPLRNPPVNWRDYISVASSRASKRTRVGFLKDDKTAAEVESITGEFTHVPLDDVHRALIKHLDDHGALWWFDTSRNMLVCHTADLKKAHNDLVMRGVFDTLATGKEHGIDHNCFAYPLSGGAWVVRRYSKGVAEHPCWSLDKSGFQRCYFNTEPDLEVAARLHNSIANEKGDFTFANVSKAFEALQLLQLTPPEIRPDVALRQATVKVLEDGVSIRVPRTRGEMLPEGWTEVNASQMAYIYRKPVTIRHEDAYMTGLSVDDRVRHLVDGRQGSGWAIRTTAGQWYLEQESAVNAVLAKKYKPQIVKSLIGQCILNPWLVVNLPFQPEYPGGRQWNRDAAQLRFTPIEKDGDWDCPTWELILSHCGSGLNDAVSQNAWCIANGIHTGADYLRMWAACLFRKSDQPLPYLFFFGPQNSGKSIYHQALGLLFANKVGYIRAETTLQNANAFNGEIAGAVLCVVEEVDLSTRGGKIAISRIKDYVGSDTIGLHAKGKTVILVRNTTHWIHCANDPNYCPIFPDDSRITMSLIPSLPPGSEIPKTVLLDKLEKEAVEFVSCLYALTIPDPATRLAIPVVNTTDKQEAAALNASIVQQFVTERAYLIPGAAVSLDDFYTAFCEWLGPESAHTWTKQRITKELVLVPGVVRGRYNGANWHYGNISLVKGIEPGKRLIRKVTTETLVPEQDTQPS